MKKKKFNTVFDKSFSTCYSPVTIKRFTLREQIVLKLIDRELSYFYLKKER